ncbi:MAG: NAD-dependent epimerase/dehydratase family protein [Pseudorhodobacter sp.]|nr:NAD-dependent epimerase/dehydratase family protein [Pseudorhodobacter sp.]
MVEKVLVTGITGFLGKHIALKLLAAGYQVCGTTRQLDRAEEVRDALRPHLSAEALLRLCFIEADLLSDTAWAAAMPGLTAVVHVAAPYAIGNPKDPQTLIRPAVEGTLRVLTMARAAGVMRVVMTSSTGAVLQPGRQDMQDERDWADPDAPMTATANRASILAERAAWDYATRAGMQLTVINAGLTLGPPLDRHFSASVGVVRRMLRGRDPMVAMVGVALSDVRDVAEMHLRAVQRPATIGKRYIGAAGSMTLPDMARLLKRAYPNRRIATMVAPRWLVQVYKLWDPQIAAMMPLLYTMPRLSNLQARTDMDLTFIPPEEAVTAAAAWLVNAGAV